MLATCHMHVADTVAEGGAQLRGQTCLALLQTYTHVVQSISCATTVFPLCVDTCPVVPAYLIILGGPGTERVAPDCCSGCRLVPVWT
jgi:hypothetical protein